jgi:hypothetical protein
VPTLINEIVGCLLQVAALLSSDCTDDGLRINITSMTDLFGIVPAKTQTTR